MKKDANPPGFHNGTVCNILIKAAKLKEDLLSDSFGSLSTL